MTSPATPRTVASAMAEAAAAWVDGLDDEQRPTGAWAWPGSNAADIERVRWYYTPTDHGGLTIHQQRPHQQRAAMRLLATGLSEAAYVSASTIMGLENVLDRTEGFTAAFARDRGRDPGMYYLRVFGDPTGAGPWSWRFGGHHVSVHHLVVDGEAVAGSPCFLGADPMVSPLLGGRELRPLGGVEDSARDLLHALDADQRARAVLTTTAAPDIIGGNRVRPAPGDRVIPLPDLWRGHFEQELEDRMWSMHDNLEAGLGVTDADREATELTATPRGLPAAADDRRPAGDAARGAGDLRRPHAARGRGARAGPLRRGRPGRRRVRLGRRRRAGRAALLPAAGSAPARGVGQHPARGQPRPLGVARPRPRLRSRPAGRAPHGTPGTHGHGHDA